MLSGLGRWVFVEIGRVVSFATLIILTLQAAVNRPREGAQVVRAQAARQIVFTAFDGVPLVAFIAAMAAVVLVALSSTMLPAMQIPGFLGDLLTLVLVREVAPAATAIIVTLRSCSAITVELGYMSARGEVEGLETLGIDPAKVLLLPRFLAVTIGTVSLTVVFVVAAGLAGFLTAGLFGVVPFSSGVIERYAGRLQPLDVVLALGKAALFGLIVASVACYHGLAVGRDITQTPGRTTRALVEALVLCTSLNVVLTLITL